MYYEMLKIRMDFPYQFYRVSVGIITSLGSNVILTKAKIDKLSVFTFR